MPRQDAVADRLVIKSNPFREISRVPAKIVNIYVKIKFDIFIAVPLPSSVPFNVRGVILFGCIFREILRLAILRPIKTRTHFMPPPVDDEHPPMKKRENIIILEKVGHAS